MNQFILNTNFQWSWRSSDLAVLKECPRKYFYRKIEGWEPISESMHLTFGTLYHKAREAYDHLMVAGYAHDDAVDVIVDGTLKETFGWETGDSKKNRETLLRSIVWSLDHYKDDPMKTVILSDGKPAVELAFRFELAKRARNGEPYALQGTLDRIVDYGDGRYIVDYKTTGSTLGSYYFLQYNPHNQMSIYILASQIVFGTEVAGVIIDAAQVAVGFTAFARGITARSGSQLEELIADTYHWLDTAEDYADKGHWPMNETACHNYGGCPFRDVCSVDPAVRNSVLETKFKKVPRSQDPEELRRHIND